LSENEAWKPHAIGGFFHLDAADIGVVSAHLSEDGVGGKNLGIDFSHQPVFARRLQLPNLSQQNRRNGHRVTLLYGRDGAASRETESTPRLKAGIANLPVGAVRVKHPVKAGAAGGGKGGDAATRRAGVFWEPESEVSGLFFINIVASADKSFAIIGIVALWKLLSFRLIVFNNFPGSSVVDVILQAARLGIAGVGEPGAK